MNIFKNKKSITYLFILSLLLLFFTKVHALPSIPNPTESFYVNDFSNVLTPETKGFITKINEQLSSTKEKPQVVVSTVKTLDDYTVEEYATKMFEKYKIGNSQYDNGVLILLATEDRKIRIEVGYGLEGALTDAKTGRILDFYLDLLKENDFDSAILKIFNDVSAEVCSEYNYDTSDIAITKSESVDTTNTTTIILIIIFILIFKTIQTIDYIKNPRGRTLSHFLWKELFYLGGSSGSSSSSGRRYGGGGRSGGGGSSRGF